MGTYSEARILVVDGGPVLRGELAARLGGLGANVVVVVDHDVAVERMIELFAPDVAIVELVSDRPGDIERDVHALGTTKVIVTVDASMPSDGRVRAIRAGAVDVVVKPLDLDELLVRVETVMRRDVRTKPTLLFGDVTIDEVGHRVHRGHAELELTVTEFNLLAMLIRNAGRVLSKRQLLATVWGFDDYDVNLVEVHISALRKKLEMNGPRIIQTVRGIGYVLRAVTPVRRCEPAMTLTAVS